MVVVAGLPASGKTTFAKKNFRRVLEYDSFASLLGSYDDLEEDRETACSLFALQAASGLYDAVVDVFPSKESRKRILDACPGAGLVMVRAPLETCLQRNARRRQKWLENDELVSIAMQFEPVSIEEGFRYIQFIDNTQEILMGKDIWLKIVDGEVQAFGDKESLDAATGGAYDMIVSSKKWDAVGNSAHVEDGAIVFGDPSQVAYERNAEIIRKARYLRLRACNKMNDMWWEDLTEEQKQAWRDYRHALLDIPQQPGFPWNGNVDLVPWPRQPE